MLVDAPTPVENDVADLETQATQIRPLRLTVRGAGDADLSIRLLGLLAQQGVEIERVLVTRDARGHVIEVDASHTPRAAVIVEKIAAMVLVRRVELRS